MVDVEPAPDQRSPRVRSSRYIVLSAAVLPLVLIAGCGSADKPAAGSTPSSTASSAAAANGKMTDLGVDTKDAKAPKITFANKPFSVSKTETEVVTEGKGAAVTKAQTLTVNYIAANGSDGKQLETSFGKAPANMNLATPGLMPGLVKGLEGQKVGSTVLIAMPPADAFGPAGRPDLGLKPADTLVFYVDIAKAITPLKSAQGKAVAPKAGLPTVKITDAAKPAKITVPKTAAPKKLVVQQLITGTGAKVKAGEPVTVSYTGVTWADGKQFDSSAGKAPFTFTPGAKPSQVIPGWDKGIIGQPVGSRLLLVVPPADGYGKAGMPQGGIKGNSTLVFVVDILAAG